MYKFWGEYKRYWNRMKFAKVKPNFWREYKKYFFKMKFIAKI